MNKASYVTMMVRYSNKFQYLRPFSILRWKQTDGKHRFYNCSTHSNNCVKNVNIGNNYDPSHYMHVKSLCTYHKDSVSHIDTKTGNSNGDAEDPKGTKEGVMLKADVQEPNKTIMNEPVVIDRVDCEQSQGDAFQNSEDHNELNRSLANSKDKPPIVDSPIIYENMAMLKDDQLIRPTSSQKLHSDGPSTNESDNTVIEGKNPMNCTTNTTPNAEVGNISYIADNTLENTDQTFLSIKASDMVANNTKYYADAFNKQYAALEESLLNRVSKQVSNTVTDRSRRTIRLIFGGIILSILFVVIVFGTKIRSKLTTQTATIAKETLENENLKIQTQELAMAVVQTILNDKEVNEQAAIFLNNAASTPETQAAFMALSMHVMSHPDTLDKLSELFSGVLVNVSKDPDTKRLLLDFFERLGKDEQVMETLKWVVMGVLKDPKINETIQKMLVLMVSQGELNDVLISLVRNASKTVLSDEEVQSYSRDFLAEVFGDSKLQQESGYALINSITHALNPGLLRVIGLGLTVASLGFLEIILSPY